MGVITSLWPFVLTVGVVLWGSSVESAKILGICPMPAYSHYSLTFRILKELADRGHDVTIISPFEEKDVVKNYRGIPIPGVLKAFDDVKKQFFQMAQASVLSSIVFSPNFGAKIAEEVFSHENVQKLLNSGEKFDIVFLETFLADALMGFAPHFNAHLVLLSPQPTSVWFNHFVGNPEGTAYMPNLLSSYTTGMNFWQRVMNWIYDSITIVKRELMSMPQNEAVLKKYLPNSPKLSEIRYNTTILLLNSHESVTTASPHVPNMIEIGGYHIKPNKELPTDLKSLLDNAKNGVIFFSLGSNVRSADMEPELIEGIIKAFSKIKQTVLWKLEDDRKDLPPNVKISKWLPQQDILAHPNVVAFISHGGLLSTIEAVFYGVPIIGIPIFGDQKTNVNTAVKNGYALRVHLNELTEKTLLAAINEITSDKRYREEVKRRSRLMHDREVKPLDSAVYWIEYVLRHNGAHHLRSPALNLAWYQNNLLDVYLFIGGVLLAIVYLIRCAIGMCCNKRKIRDSHDTKKKNK